MNAKKLMLATAITASLTGLYGCSEGDDSTLTINSETTTGGGTGSTGTLSEGCPDWTTAKQKDADGNNVCALPSTIEEDRTLTNDIVWLMEGRVTVGNGNGKMSATEGTLEDSTPVMDVTLFIQPGTEVKGATGTFANLVVTRGSALDANGSEDNPIIFSSDDDGYEGTGEWGGIILQGYGVHNNAEDTCSGGTCQNVDSEGESGFAGGTDNSDSSGRLKYVIVTEGGYEFAPGDEINGISFVAVGSGTEVDYVQVNSNSDDGVEFYGGAVNAKHLVLTGNLDDSVDWDEGYQGHLQHVLVIQAPETEGNAIEADTRGFSGTLTTDILSKPVVANATFIGDGSKDTLMVFKEESGVYLLHTALTGASGSSITTCEDTSNATSISNALVFDSVVGDCTAAASGITSVADVQLQSDYSIADTTVSSALDVAAIKSAYTPDSDFIDATFFDVTDYAGAVNPDGSDLWYQNWTLDGSL